MSRLFDGVNDIINHGSGAALDNLMAGGMTLTMWIYRTGDGSGASSLPRVAEKNPGWIFGILKSSATPASAPQFNDQRATTNRFRRAAANTITNDTWWFMAVTVVDSTAKTDIHMYTAEPGDAAPAEVSYDGGADGSGAHTDDASGDLGFGGNPASPTGSPFLGRIADVRIYDDVILSVGELTTIFNGKLTRAATIQSPYWGIASPEADVSGNGHNGTVTGAVVADHPPIGLTFGYDYGWQGAFTAAAAAGGTHPQLSLLGVGA